MPCGASAHFLGYLASRTTSSSADSLQAWLGGQHATDLASHRSRLASSRLDCSASSHRASSHACTGSSSLDNLFGLAPGLWDTNASQQISHRIRWHRVLRAKQAVDGADNGVANNLGQSGRASPSNCARHSADSSKRCAY